VQTEEYISDENTVLLLHLNETSGNIAYDESSYSNNGTIHTNQISEGKFFSGRSFPFNNTDYGITLPYTSSLNIIGGEPITMEAWIKTDIYEPGATQIIRLDEYQLYLGSFGGKGHLQFFRRDGNNWNICQTNNLIPLNEWVHLLATYNGSDTKMYINGIEQEYTVFINTYNQVNFIRIASFNGISIQPTAAVLIDEVRISNVARDEELVANYPFNGNANDESGNGNDGTVIGALLNADRFGNGNSAYFFDGIDDEIILGSEAFNFVNHSYSISVWARWDKESNLGTHILDKQGYPVNGGGGYRLYTGATGEIIFAISTEVFGSGFVEYNTHIIPNLNTWYHIVVNADVTGSTTVYINGEAKVTDLSEPLIGNAFELKLGRRIDFDGSRFKGIIDDVRFYNTILTEAEILELYGGFNDGLVAYYPFNGNTNDESGNENDGTLYGPLLTEDRFGNPNSAYLFDGDDDYIDCGNNQILDQTGSLTLSAWFKLYSLPSELNNDEVIVGKWRYDQNKNSYILNIDFQTANNFQLVTSNCPTEEVIYGGEVTKNNWYHYVGVVDQEQQLMKIYVNGVLVAVDTYSGQPNCSTSENLLIGKINDNGGSNHFHGVIDEIRIYSYALTEAEILELYGGLNDGLVAYYPFNGNANDESGNEHHGSIISNPVFITDRHGNQNSALSFDGIDDWIEVSSSSLFPSDAITFCYWINRDGNDITFLQNYISKEFSFQSYILDNSGGKIYLSLVTG